jgi:lipoyl(octanoyl) transferase
MGRALLHDLGVMDYDKAYRLQLALVEKRKTGALDSDIFLLTEHPAVFTLGRRGGRDNLMVSEEFLKGKGVALVHVERGGDITYHGRGQVVVYPIIELRTAGLSISDYIYRLEEVMLRLCADFDVQATRDARNHGIWLGESKLGSVGIAIRHGITFHGLALNINTALEAFGWIHPCGLTGVRMTSLAQELKKELPMVKVKQRLSGHLQAVFKRAFAPVPQQMDENGYSDDHTTG